MKRGRRVRLQIHPIRRNPMPASSLSFLDIPPIVPIVHIRRSQYLNRYYAIKFSTLFVKLNRSTPGEGSLHHAFIATRFLSRNLYYCHFVYINVTE